MEIKDLKDVFEPFDRLVKIKINGREVEVPENNMILRCFQFLSIESISMGDFCWNGDCAECQVWIEGTNGEKPVLSCRTKVAENMNILRLSDAINLDLEEYN